MFEPKIPKDEASRLNELKSFEILDSNAEKQFDDITMLATKICETPIALVSLVDERRQWFKSKQGLTICETQRELAFCAHAINQKDIFIVEDAREDKRFIDNPLVTGDSKIIFYAGMPLRTSNGLNIGTLCVIDHKPRRLTENQIKSLRILANQVVLAIETRLKVRKLDLFSNMMVEIHYLANLKTNNLECLFEKYLSKGSKILGLDVGIISSIKNDKYTVMQVVDKDNSIKIGQSFSIENTYCAQVVEHNETFFHNNIGQDRIMVNHPCYLNTKLESYIGTPIYLNGEIYGTLSYSSSKIKTIRFSDYEIRFVEILAQTISRKLDVWYGKKDQQEARIRAEKLLKAKSIFLANMSHEIRTPLNSIIGLCDLLAISKLDNEQKEYITTLQNSSEVLLDLVNDILDLSKIEEGELVLDYSELDFTRLFEKILDMFKRQANEKRIALKFNIDNEVDKIYKADFGRITQIVINLVGNALKFTKSGSIEFSLAKNIYPDKRGNLLLKVTDTGIGIAKDKLKVIYQSFAQEEATTTRDFGGTGLGLAIVQKIATSMGGSTWVESQKGVGSTFYVTLSLDEVNEKDGVLKFSREEQLESTIDMSFLENSQLSILLVDDSANNRSLIKAYLKNFPFKIKEATNGKQALKYFKEEKFDLVLMDIQMPVMDGYEAVRRIREFEQETDVEATGIFSLTAYAQKEEQEKCLAIGCNDHLVKPLKRQKLLSRMTSYLQRDKERLAS